MQQAIPYSSGGVWAPRSPTSPSPSPSCSTAAATAGGGGGGSDGLKRLVAENPVLVIGRRGCCMCHVAKRLLLGLGVNPPVCEVGDEVDEAVLMLELTAGAEGRRVQAAQVFLPAVFIGGRLVGGIDRLMAVHISGDLVPILKDAGALWL